MTTDGIIIAAIAVPSFLLLLLRSNAALVFLSLCLGSLLAQVAANDTSKVLSSFSSVSKAENFNYVALALLVLPPILTAIFMIRTTKPSHILLQLLPAIGVGAAALLLAQPYLPDNISQQFTQTALWQKIDALQVIIVSLSAFVCLLVVWMQRPHHAAHEKPPKH